MKKRTIVFLLVLSALLGVLGISCAYAAESYPEEFLMLCFVCKSEQRFYHMGYIEVDLEGEYTGQKGHVPVNRCTKCLQNDIQPLDARPHTVPRRASVPYANCPIRCRIRWSMAIRYPKKQPVPRTATKICRSAKSAAIKPIPAFLRGTHLDLSRERRRPARKAAGKTMRNAITWAAIIPLTNRSMRWAMIIPSCNSMKRSMPINAYAVTM